MESLSVGGLASGLDTNAIIDGLTDLELNKVRRIERKQSEVSVKLDAFNQLKGRISDFAKSAELLDNVKTFNLYENTSSDEDHASVSGDEDAISGTYNLEIAQLATVWKTSSKGFTDIVTALGMSGTFQVNKSAQAIENDPQETTVDVDIDAGDSLKDIARKINGTEGIGVSASLITLSDNDHRLVLNAVDDGTQGFYIKDVGGTNVLDEAGLGFINNQQQIKSDFNFRLSTIGPAQADTDFQDIFTGIGTNAAIDAGDTIDISGTDANGNAVSGAFTFGASNTIQDLLDEVQNTFQSQGSSVEVSLNSSGEILIKDLGGGVEDMTLQMAFNDSNASGSDLKLTPTNGQGHVLNSFQNVLSQGQKAFFTLDGLSVASDSNRAKGAVSGVTFELKKAELGKPVEVSLERDFDAIKERVQSFVDAYNSVIGFIDEKTKVEIKGDDENPNEKQTVGRVGPFASDSSILRIKNDLRRMMTSTIEELQGRSEYTSFAGIGITSRSGTLSIDDEDLQKALEQDFEGVRNLFITHGFSDNTSHSLGTYDKNTKTGVYNIDADGSTIEGNAATRNGDVLTSTQGDSNGLTVDAPEGSGSGLFTFVRGVAGQISNYWKRETDQYEGYLSVTGKNFQDTIDRLSKRAGRMEEQVENFRQRLISQFSNLEVSMSRLKSQSASFMSQIGSL